MALSNQMTNDMISNLNNQNPADQLGQIGNKIDEALLSPIIITFPITADASGTNGLAVTIPFNCEIVDVIVQCRATNGGGTMTLRKSTTAITDAIVMATNKAMVRAGTIDTAQSVVLASDTTINVKTNGASDRGLVTLICKRTATV